MPKRGIQQHLRNFEAIASELEPCRLVNDELFLGNVGNTAHIELATRTIPPIAERIDV